MDWRDRAKQDLEFIYQTLRENHPGQLDKSKEGNKFRKWLEEGFRKSINSISRIKSKQDYENVLSKYIQGFDDVHVRLEKPDKGKVQAERQFFIREYQKDRVWVKIPSFLPRTKKEFNKLNDIIEKIENYRNNELIVFDMRNTEGGATVWGDRIIEKLWGKEFISSRKNFPGRNKYAKIRVSQGNLNHYKNCLKGANLADKTKGYFTEVVSKIEKAIRQNKEFIILKEPRTKVSKAKKNNPVYAKIIIITDKSSRSASIIFLDKLLSLPNTIQIGQQTSADTPYTEIRKDDLPSREFTLISPTKIRYNFRSQSGPFIPRYKIKDLNDVDKIKNKINQIISNPKEKSR